MDCSTGEATVNGFKEETTESKESADSEIRDTVQSHCAFAAGASVEASALYTDHMAVSKQSGSLDNMEESANKMKSSAETAEAHLKGRPPSKKRKKKASGVTSGRWTTTEHEAFLTGLAVYGREWKQVAADIPTRTSAQVRSHAQKYFARLNKQQQDGVWMASTADMSSSAQEEAARILADPGAVQQRVTRTLEQLRERYKDLQARIREAEGSTGSSVEDELVALQVLQGGLSDGTSRGEDSSKPAEDMP